MNLTDAMSISIHMEATGLNIRRLRIENKYTVDELAEALGLESGRVIYKWQKGLCLPSLDKMVIMSYLFKTSVDEIIIDSVEAARMGLK